MDVSFGNAYSIETCQDQTSNNTLPDGSAEATDVGGFAGWMVSTGTPYFTIVVLATVAGFNEKWRVCNPTGFV